MKIPSIFLYGRNRNYNHTINPIKVAYVSGANLMIKKSFFEKIGGFDENIFMYFDETDLCKRATKYGNIFCTPSSSIIHYGGQSSKDSLKLPSPQKTSMQNKSMWYFIKKHHSSFYCQIYYYLYVVFAISRIIESMFLCKRDYMNMWINDLKQVRNYKK